MAKIAFITGINGQDGAYLSRLLLDKGYQVHGLIRRASIQKNDRISDILDDVQLHYGDLTDATNLVRLVKEIEPDEIYNLAAQSHVAVSFESPEYTANADALGTLRLLEAIRILGLEKKTKFYQASSSELYGNTDISPQNEQTPFQPCSPYGAAKLYAYWITRNYRDAYGIYACNGILFNHESPLRGAEFVTRKITKAVAEISKGRSEPLELGNLDARRDWGHASDYVRGMWMMMQQGEADDFVLATGRAETVRWFVQRTFEAVSISIKWQGQGADEKGLCSETGRELVHINPEFYRPTDVGFLLGDADKASETLGWTSNIPLEDMIEEMVQTDLREL